MSAVNASAERCPPLGPSGNQMLAHGWGQGLLDVGDQACMGLSVSSARHRRSTLVEGPAARPCPGGMCDDRRGARHCGAPVIAPQACMRSTRPGPNHDAAVRIGGEAPGRRAHSLRRLRGPCLIPGHRHLGPSSAARRGSPGGRRNRWFDLSSGWRLTRLDGDGRPPAALLSSLAAKTR